MQIRKLNLERFMSGFFFICALVSIAALVLITLFLVFNSLPAFSEIGIWQFITGRSWTPTNTPPAFGILPMIVGSTITTAIAVIIGVPIGLFTAIFLAYMCPKVLYKIFKPAVNLLAGIPSIVYGFFGLQVIVIFIRNISQTLTSGGTGLSLLSAGILLGIMILPTIIVISEASLKAIPKNYYEGALALGASHTRTVFAVIVPAAKSGIFAAVILGIGRAIGETMAVVMVVGGQAIMPYVWGSVPLGIMRGGRTLTANIVMEMGYAADLHRYAIIATAVVLLLFVLIINLIFNAFNKRR